MTNIKKGDKVKVRKDLLSFDRNEQPKIVEDMIDLQGKTFIVEGVLKSRFYAHNYYYIRLKDVRFSWLPKWLEKVEELPEDLFEL